MTLRLSRILILLVLLVVTGCQTGPPMGTVNGEVTLNNQRIKEGAITFSPIEGDTATAGTTILDGKFTAQVPVGKQKVMINASRVMGKFRAYETPESPLLDNVVELIPPEYNANSTLSIDVQPGVQNVRYDLKSRP